MVQLFFYMTLADTGTIFSIALSKNTVYKNGDIYVNNFNNVPSLVLVTGSVFRNCCYTVYPFVYRRFPP